MTLKLDIWRVGRNAYVKVGELLKYLLKKKNTHTKRV